jgi:hypothetical protein
MPEQLFPDSLFLGPGHNISMTDKRYIFFVLDTHDPEQLAFTFQAPENNTIFNLIPELC